MAAVEFFVPGKPRGRDERSTGKGRSTHVYTTDEGRNWRETLKLYAMQCSPELPWEGAVTLSITFLLTRPNNHWTTKGELSAAGRRKPRPTSKPDLDNLMKPVKDSLKGAGFYQDDAQVTDAHPHKRYCDREQGPGVQITVRRHEGEA